jgi:hypothetical protein
MQFVVRPTIQDCQVDLTILTVQTKIYNKTVNSKDNLNHFRTRKTII